MSVGHGTDTVEFAVHLSRQWWKAFGMQRFPNATRLLITADSGGSNGYRARAWKFQLAKLAAETVS